MNFSFRPLNDWYSVKLSSIEKLHRWDSVWSVPTSTSKRIYCLLLVWNKFPEKQITLYLYAMHVWYLLCNHKLLSHITEMYKFWWFMLLSCEQRMKIDTSNQRIHVLCHLRKRPRNKWFMTFLLHLLWIRNLNIRLFQSILCRTGS